MSRRGILLGIVLVAVIIGVALLLRMPFFMLSGRSIAFSRQQGPVAVTGSYPSFGRPAVDSDIRLLIERSVVEPLATSTDERPATTKTVLVMYRTPYRTVRYAGVVFDVSVQARGQGNFVLARTYDLFRDRTVALEDFAVPGTDPYSAALNAVQFALRGRPGIELARLQQIRPDPSSLSDFIARPDGLEFYLDPGMVAPPEAGVIVVNVPWEELVGLQQP